MAWPDASLRCCPPPAGTTTPLLVVMETSSLRTERGEIRYLAATTMTSIFIFGSLSLASSCLLRSVFRFWPGGQPGDNAAHLVGSDAQIIGRLQVKPEFGAGLEPVAQPQRRVARDGALAMNDLRDAIGWYADLPRQFGRRYAKPAQFVRQDLSGMDCWSRHQSSSLVISHDLDIGGASRQHLLHLVGDVLRGFLGDHAREIHAVAEHAGLAHARAGGDSPDVAHAATLNDIPPADTR